MHTRHIVYSSITTFALTIGSFTAVADDASLEPTRADLLDPAWIETALADVGIDRLIKLYDQDDAAEPDATVQLVQDALLLSRAFLSEHPQELRSQLQARLLSSDDPELQVFQDLPADRVRARMTRPSLAQAGDARLAVIPVSHIGLYFAASTDGTLIATNGNRLTTTPPFETLCNVEIHSGITGELLQVVGEGPVYIAPAGFSHDDSQVYGVSQDNVLHAWDVRSGEEIWNGLCAFGELYRAIAVSSPDGSRVAVTTFTPQVIVHDAYTGEEVTVLSNPEGQNIGHIAFLDNNTLVGCCYDQKVRHWDIGSGEVSEELDFAAWAVTRDGTKIVVMDSKYVETENICYGFAVHDTSAGEELARTGFDEPTHINSMDVDPAGERLNMVTDRPERQLLVYSLATGASLATINIGTYFGTQLIATSGNRVLTHGMGNAVHVWDVSRQIRDDESLVRGGGVDVTANGATAMTYSYDGIRIWDTELWQETARFDIEQSYLCARMSDDGSRILYKSRDEVHLIDVATEQTNLVLKTGDGSTASSRVLGLSGDGLVGAAIFAAATDLEEGKAVLFDVETGELLASTESATVISLSYDGSQAMLATRHFDSVTGAETAFEPAHARYCDMSDDGRLAIAGCSFVGNVVWDLTTREQVKGAAFELDEIAFGAALPVAISGDGRFTASCNGNGDIYLYDTRELRPLAVVYAEHETISSLALNYDGACLLVGTDQGNWHHFRFENLPP